MRLDDVTTWRTEIVFGFVFCFLIFGATSPVRAQPAGSYLSSCKNSRAQNDTLFSSCRDKHKRYHDTSLAQISQCVGAISNDNGALRCASYGPVPVGPYQKTCRNIRLQNDTLFSSCLDTHGGYHETSLAQVSHCTGSSILNDNGALHCSMVALPTGTYSKACGRVRVENGTLFGECRKIGGGTRSTSLPDIKSCWAGTDISNIDGYLSCEKGDRPAPAGSYRETCRDLMMNQGVLSAKCLNNSREFKAASLNILHCQQQVENRNAQLTCGHVAQPKPPLPPAQGFSAVEVFNCQTNRRLITVWAVGSDQSWTRKGQISSGYVDNVCPERTSPSLTVQLAPGLNVIRALDPAQCGGADDPQNYNCQVGELSVTGLAGGAVAPYPVGNF